MTAPAHRGPSPITAPARLMNGPLTGAWWLFLGAGLVVAVLARVSLLPAQGWRPDLDLFASWVHVIATTPLGEAYRSSLNFGPVFAAVYWLLGIAQPAFATATDASGLGVRLALKLPAVIADLGLVAGVAWLVRDRPRWAVVAAIGVALSPAVLYDGSWWGQSESIYVLAGLLATILALGGRPYLAAIALAAALMAKPQALVFVAPMAAWAWSSLGPRRAAIAGLVVIVTAAILWVPFLADDGPMRFIATIARVQGEQYPVLSARAWNPWWILQTAVGRGFLSDRDVLLGPLSPRLLGYLTFAILELLIALAVVRDPGRRGLLLGMAASVLVGFLCLTSMHERYAYGALVFLAPLLPDRRILATWLTLEVTVFLNLVAAAPPSDRIAAAIPVDGALGLVGAAVITASTGMVLWLLIRQDDAESRSPI